MLWNNIKSKEDLDNLNNLFGNFHDSCLKEMCFSTGGYVENDLSIYAYSNPIARFLFQRQWKEPSVIEIEFSNVLQINIKPEGENNFIDIINAHIYLSDGIFFWSAKDYEMKEEGKDEYTWIEAKNVCWRVRDELIGKDMVYMKD